MLYFWWPIILPMPLNFSQKKLVLLLSLFLTVYSLQVFSQTPSSCFEVGSEQKISEVDGNFGGTLTPLNYFGSGLASMGDFDNDGNQDIVVGAVWDDDGGVDKGAIWMLYLNSTGSVISEQKISETTGGFGGTFTGGGEFGAGIHVVGDLNNDGVTDLAVGEPLSADGGMGRGAVWILFMNATGTVSSEQKISDIQGNFLGALNNQDQFGRAVTNVGDLNNDGISDVAVGAPMDDDGGGDRGAVWILFLDTNGTVQSHQKISDTQGGFTGGLGNADQFGAAVDSIGDINGDGINDIAVGAPRDDDGGTDRGAVWVLFLDTNGTVKGEQKISVTQGCFTGTLNNDDQFGFSVSEIGDLNGDGTNDIIVGAPRNDDGGLNKGATFCVFLKPNGEALGQFRISDTQGNFSGALQFNDFFGWAVLGGPDIDGDGIRDLVVGAPGDDASGNSEGAIHVLFPVDTCTNCAPLSGTTFQRTYGGTGEDRGTTLIPTTDGGYALVGLTNTYGAGNYDGMLMKFNSCMQLEWTKTYGQTGQEEFASVLETDDCGLLLSGRTFSFGVGGHDYYIVKTDYLGNTQWSRTIGGSPGEWVRVSRKTPDGGYTFMGYTGLGAGANDMLMVHTDAAGATLWAKTYGNLANDFPNHFEVTSDSGYIVSGYRRNYTALTNYQHFLTKLDSSGNVQWYKTYSGTGQDIGIGVMEMPNGDFVSCGSTTINGAGGMDVLVIRTDSAGNLIWSKTYGGTSNERGFSVQLTSAGNILVYGNTESFGAGLTDEYLLQLDPQGNLMWSETYGGTGTDTRNFANDQGLHIADDGGFLFTGSTNSMGAGGHDVYLIKTDSSGFVNCNTNGAATIEAPIIMTTANPVPAVAAALISNNLVTSIVSTTTPQDSVLCFVQQCVGGQSTFMNNFGGTGDEQGHSVKKTLDGGYVVAGITDSEGAGLDDIFVMKTDAAGNTIWSKTYGDTGIDGSNFVSVEVASDSTYIVATGTESFGAQGKDGFIFKIDAIGTVIWEKRVAGASTDIFMDVTPTSNGGYTAVGSVITYGAGSNDIHMIHYDNNGNTQWTKTFGGTFADHCSGIEQTADTGYILACNSISFGAGGRSAYLIKTDSNGVMQWDFIYDGTGQDMFSDAKPTSDGGYIAVGYTFSFSGSRDVFLVKVDSAGSMEWAKTYGGTSEDRGNYIEITNDGGYIIGGFTESFGAGGRDIILIKTDASGNVEWSQTYGDIGTEDMAWWADGLVQANDSGFVFAGWSNSFSNGTDDDILLIKTDGCGNTDCFSQSVTIVESSVTPTVSSPVAVLDTGGVAINTALVDSSFSPQITMLCAPCLVVANFTTSNDTVCPGDTIFFTNTSTGAASYSWLIDLTPYSTAQDTAISVFAPGTYTISLVADSNCSDTLHKQVVILAPQTGFLGNDTTFCQGDSLTITPLSTFGSYDWSTGDTTASITVDTAGSFILQVNDTNSCAAFDTIVVGVSQVPLIVVSNDTTLCSTAGYALSVIDSLGLTNTFVWNPGALLNDSTVVTPIILQDTTATYYVTAIDSASGCSSNDSVTITLLPTLVLSLSNDTTICFGDTTQLMALDSGIYSWSPAASLNDSTIANPLAFPDTTTDYVITLTDTFGCPRVDTITVTVLPSPSGFLGSDTIICAGDSLTISPLTTFPGYLWSTGDTSSSIVTDTAGTYTLQVTDSNTCSGLDTIVVGVNPLPVILLTNDTIVCSTSQFQLSAVDSLGLANTFFWTPATLLNDSSISNPIITLDTTATYYVTIQDSASGCSSSDSVTVTLVTPQVLSVSTDTTICLGDTMQLQVVGSGTYAWSPNTNLNDSTIANPLAYPDSSTNYIIAVTDTFGCSYFDTVAITVNYLPDFDLGNDTSFCSGDSVVFDASEGFLSYLWHDGSTDSTFVATDTGQYAVTVTNSCGQTADTVEVLTIFPLPVFTIGPDTGICPVDSLELTVPLTQVAYLWSTTDTSVSIWSFGGNNYSVTVTDSNNCVFVDSINVNSNPVPVVNLGNDTALCDGDSLVLNAFNTGATYNWSTINMDSAIVINAANTYWVEVLNTEGCTTTDTIAITYNPLPVVNIGNDITICDNELLALDAGNTGSTYLWSTTATSQTISPIGTATYWVQVTDGNGCQNSDTSVVTVNPAPVVNFPTIPGLCQGDSLILYATNPNGATYQWSNGATSDSLVIDVTGTYTVTVSNSFSCVTTETANVIIFPNPLVYLGPDKSACLGATFYLHAGFDGVTYNWSNGTHLEDLYVSDSGMYHVEVINSDGCISRDSVNIHLYPFPDIDLGADTTFCAGDSTMLNAASTNATYLWSTGETTPQIVANVSGEYEVIVTSDEGCLQAGSIIISVVDTPSFNFGGDTVLCAGSALELSIDGDIQSFAWSTGQLRPSIKVTRPGIYWASANNGVCEKSDTAEVILKALPVDSLPHDTTVCFGLNPGGVLLDAGNAGSSYFWTNGSIAQQAAIVSEGIHTVTITDTNGCVLVKSIDVNAFCESAIYIPSAFSPNDDRHNGVFRVQGTNVVEFELTIYDRWGERLFQTKDIDEGWDGTYRGYLSQIGVYVYLVKYAFYTEGGEFVREKQHGTVTLIR